jgi:hypothetical protein
MSWFNGAWVIVYILWLRISLWFVPVAYNLWAHMYGMAILVER